MLPSEHILYGFIAALIIFILFPPIGSTGLLIIVLASILVDADHYVNYIIKKKDWNFSRAVDYYLKIDIIERSSRKQQEPLMFLHTFEFLILLIILAFFNEFFIYVSIGIAIHIALDFVHLKKNDILHTRTHSVIYSWLKKRR